VIFVFVGDGAEKPKLLAEAGSLANVRFLNPVDHAGVRDFYALADVCLVPLRDIPLFDTFIPSKIFELMAMGRPMLASVRGETARILSRAGAAEIVAPEDDGAMAGAIGALMANPARRMAMGTAGRSYVEAHYSRQRLAARYLDVVAEVCR
jgi:hypothetical protein